MTISKRFGLGAPVGATTSIVTIEMTGGSGGGGWGAGGNSRSGAGGRAMATFEIPNGTTLTVYVGQRGNPGPNLSNGGTGGGGWGAGGKGGTQDSNQTAGGGGGSSAVTESSTILIASAGGGGATTHSGSGTYATGGSTNNNGPSSQGGSGSKTGTNGPVGGDGAVTGCRGGGGGGTDSSRDAGAPSYGGQSYVNTGIYSGAVSTSFTLTVPAAVTGNVVGIAGTVKITDRAGTTTYTALGPSSHIVT